MDQIENDFASIVIEVRKQLGISQEGLARELKVSFATVNRWENRQTEPSRSIKGRFRQFCLKMRRSGKLSDELYRNIK